MGQQSRRERVRRVIEHTVPLGADMADLGKAWDAALREWASINDLAWDKIADLHPPDDWAHVTADDQHVIIRMEVEEGR